MIHEIAILYIKSGKQKEFERDFAIAGQYISSIEGYLGHRLQKCIGQDNKYILQADWKKLEDHTETFRKSEAYIRWKNLLHHYYEPFPVVEHFETITESTRL